MFLQMSILAKYDSYHVLGALAADVNIWGSILVSAKNRPYLMCVSTKRDGVENLKVAPTKIG